MADTPPNTWKAMQGFALLAVIAFIVFVAAGFGWYAGTALARVLGL